MKVFSNALKPALSSALQPLVLGSGVISYVKKTLEQEIKSIFSKYATAPKAWYDPSDMRTLYQDSAGTLPVTASGQPVGLMLDKSLGLVRGPELTTNGSFDAGASGWDVRGADATHIVTFSGGALRFQSDTTSPQLRVGQTTGTQPGRTYEVTVVCSAWVSGSVKIFESTLGQLVVSGVGTFRARMRTTGAYFDITRNSINVDLTLDSVSLRELPGNHLIQPGTTNRPIFTQGGDLSWLQFDGVDDDIYSASPVGMAGTDKVSVIAGLRKESDSGTGTLVEYGDAAAGANGTFSLLAPTGATPTFAASARGTTGAAINSPGAYPSPRTGVATLTADIASSAVALRIDAQQVAASAASLGTGNFSNAVLKLGRRQTGAAPFNGRLYGLVITPAMLTGDDLALVESWNAQRAGVTLP